MIPMNRLSCLLYALASSLIIMSNTGVSAQTSTVWIRNSLHSHKDLIVHCKSYMEDMGYHRVHSTGSYSLRYREVENDDDYTVFCRLWQGPNFKHHQVFDVDNGNIWEAREDGIYLSLDLRKPAFVYSWDDRTSKASSLRSTYVSLKILRVAYLHLLTIIYRIQVTDNYYYSLKILKRLRFIDESAKIVTVNGDVRKYDVAVLASQVLEAELMASSSSSSSRSSFDFLCNSDFSITTISSRRSNWKIFSRLIKFISFYRSPNASTASRPPTWQFSR
ncbi:unnamed protein product [Microthlaspi erraticum]|uniref:S-protein homolog n=1 Tax=Microthlaspi erraticum TaxID=1685480 RepID=A0A6D2K158_9BRAS|nr:unnamed protein product [Microthlaspi erraticum]